MVYKARFHHSGAMINEMLILIRHFDETLSREEWIRQIIESNLLGKNTRSWLREIIVNNFYPRFVNGVIPNAYKHIRILDKKGVPLEILKAIMYYHTALWDEFIYDYITLHLFEKYFSGQTFISAKDVYDYIETIPEEKFYKHWNDYVKRRLSRGVMATLRDFGILEGRNQKKIANFHLPLEVFLYIAYLLQLRYQSGDKIVSHRDWRLFLLTERNVDRLFLHAHQENLLKYQAAGGIIRIEFFAQNLEELLNAIAERTTNSTGI